MVFSFQHFNGLFFGRMRPLSFSLPPTTHFVRLPEPVVDPEETQGPARGLVALASHGGWLEREKAKGERKTAAASSKKEKSRQQM